MPATPKHVWTIIEAARSTARRAPAAWPALVLVASMAASGAAHAAPEPIAVVACDGYNDLRRQIAWLGEQVGNPGLAIMAESMIAMGTQGRGLAGLDAKRPMGVVVFADGGAVSGSGYVPVKDVDKLLDSLKGLVGPAETDGDDRRIAVPQAGAVRVSTKDGWAILSPEALPKGGSADPATLIEPLAEEFSVAIQVFPSRMPEPLRRLLADRIRQMAAQSAQAAAFDENGIASMLDSLDQTESMTIGVRFDEEKNRVVIENRSVAVEGSEAARVMAGVKEAPLTVPLPSGGPKPVVRAFIAHSIPKEAAAPINQWIDASKEGDSDDSLSRAVLGTLRAIAKAAVASGRLDGSMALVAEAADPRPAIELTAGLHVADGPSLERSIKGLVGPAAGLPAFLAVKLDAGRVGNANLHTLSFDLSNNDAADVLGESFEATVAIAPECCYLLAGGDVKGRLAEMLEKAAPAATANRPVMALQVAVDRAIELAAANRGDDAIDAAVAAAAAAAENADSCLLQVQLRKVDRGVAWQASLDSGALKAAAAAAAASQGRGPAAGGGLIGPPGGAIGP